MISGFADLRLGEQKDTPAQMPSLATINPVTKPLFHAVQIALRDLAGQLRSFGFRRFQDAAVVPNQLVGVILVAMVMPPEIVSLLLIKPR